MPEPPFVCIEDGSDLTRQAWSLLQSRLPGAKPIRPVLDFRDEADQTPSSIADRTAILDQAALLFAHFYPHLPFKQNLYEFAHPERMLDPARESIGDLAETHFHSFVIAGFSLVRDAHTLYGLPSPYRNNVAFLPFLMRPMGHDPARYFVTRVMSTRPVGGFEHPFFGPGAEIVGMGSEDIEWHIQRAAGRLPGGNAAAVQMRGALACTIRPLRFLQFPFDDEMPGAAVFYRPAGGGDLRAIQLPWGVVEWTDKLASFPAGTFSMSSLARATTACAELLHGGGSWDAPAAPPDPTDFRQVSKLPGVFEFTFTGGPRKSGPIDLRDLATPEFPDARFGYIAIRSFVSEKLGLQATNLIVEEFRRILILMDESAPDGLVLDIRGNPGGDIIAAERMLQMLTGARIEPARFHLANTAAMLTVLSKATAEGGDANVEFRNWVADAAGAPLPEGEALTSGQPLTKPADANAIGQIYQGPVALLVDALTYSAADIFAGGFQDHQIGVILGADCATGAGGANVWDHEDLVETVGPLSDVPLRKLPGDATMSLAIRRSSRVGASAGKPIEDCGVEVDVQYTPESVDDLIRGYPGMIRRACLILGRIKPARVDLTAVAVLSGGAVDVTVGRTARIDDLRFFLDDQLALTQAVEPAGDPKVHVPAVAGHPFPSVLRVEGCVRVKDATGGLTPVPTVARQVGLTRAVAPRPPVPPLPGPRH